MANGAKGQTDWNAVEWRQAMKSVCNLRQRIFRASAEGDHRTVRSLQKLMLRSYSNALLAVRRVTQVNKGKSTPGVDKVVIRTPKARGELVDQLMRHEPAKPARRVYIPKANGKRRPLGIPVIADRPGSGGQTAPGKWGRSGAECARPSGGNRLQQNTETMLVQNHIDRISYALPEVINEETGASVLLSWSIPC